MMTLYHEINHAIHRQEMGAEDYKNDYELEMERCILSDLDPYEDNYYTGGIQIYKAVGDNWIESSLINEESGVGELELSENGSTIVYSTGNNSPEVKILKNVNNSWIQVGSIINVDTFFYSLDISDDGKVIQQKYAEYRRRISTDRCSDLTSYPV